MKKSKMEELFTKIQKLTILLNIYMSDKQLHGLKSHHLSVTLFFFLCDGPYTQLDLG